jgi:hypothetical protein
MFMQRAECSHPPRIHLLKEHGVVFCIWASALSLEKSCICISLFLFVVFGCKGFPFKHTFVFCALSALFCLSFLFYCALWNGLWDRG